MREVFVTWHNLFDTAEYVANNLNVEYQPDCKDRVKYVTDRMIKIIEVLAKEENPQPLGEYGYIAIPKVNYDNTLKITFFVIVSVYLDDLQRMKYVGNNTFEVQI